MLYDFPSRRVAARCGQRVYFASSLDRPGQIKIGVSGNLPQRMRAGRMALLASIPGYWGREAMLHWAMRDLRLDGEWFRSEPKLWRLVIEATDKGNLDWLPGEFEATWHYARPRRDAMRAHYGSLEAAAAALDCSPQCIGPGVHAWARFLVERQRAGFSIRRAA